jgi:hypothetical protein
MCLLLPLHRASYVERYRFRSERSVSGTLALDPSAVLFDSV